ncbi:cysteine dioxygenase [Jiangella endophytica]|uniref:cysteine dioxygenase n=1 Tax=Jiangella endophytica TaxID=1623398 RepID=UPI000E34C0CF|nr:cysteine dioxygenase family protein [Jiangella endophytica]
MTIALPRPARHDGPTPVSLHDLVDLTRIVAAQVREGRHPVHFDSDDRWSVRLSSDPYTDVWLISWTQEQSTELHDHAGSLGALTVVSGVVTERFWTPSESGLRERRLRDGRGVGFPVGHVHDVVNTDPAPAVTVHAYSPPLTAMGYYEVDGAGALRRVRTVLTDEPEPAR